MPNKTQNKVRRIIKVVLPWLAFFGMLLITVKIAHAQSYLGGEWDKYLGDVQTFAPTSQSGEELAISFILNAIRIVRNVVGGVALIMGVLYGVRLVISRGQEEAINQQKKNFLYALFGFMILIVSENVARIFNPEFATTDQLVDFDAARDQLRDIVDYIKWLLGSVIVLMFTISSVRMVASQGQDEEIEKQKKNMTFSFIGMLVILLASNIVNAIYVINEPRETAAASPDAAVTEITSVVRLALVFLGPMAIAFTIYAGFLYLTALDNEERATKGRRMIVYGVVAIALIYGAYAIVNTLTSANLGFLSSYMV